MSHKKYRKETNCLNCGAEVTGKFCPQCGQENLETKENFFHLAFHFVSDYFHFDSKFFRSLIPLFTRPGFLTKQYWDGKRVNYIHPLRLYFFITIVFMIVATYFNNHLDKEKKKSFIDTNVTLSHEDSVTFASDPNPKARIEAMIKEKKAMASSSIVHGVDQYFHDLKYVAFLMLPIYAMAFKLLYLRRKKLYVEHLVYTLHLQSFAFVLISAVFMIAILLPEYFSIIRRLTVFSIFLYIVFSLRFLYNQSWWKTIFKSVIATFLLVFSMGIALGAYVVYFIISEGSRL